MKQSKNIKQRENTILQINDNTIYIIGGGPAGLAAAISAYDEITQNQSTKNTSHPKIVILEKSEKLGQTILRTGNGRCNFSNINIEGGEGCTEYNHPAFFEEVINNVSERCVSRFFDKLGLGCQIKNDGMMFPYTNKATSVLDVLRFAVEERNIKACTNVKEEEIANLVDATMYDRCQNSHKCRVIIATGGNDKTTKNLLSQKIKVEPTYKILGPIKVNKPNLKNLDGIRANIALSVIKEGKKIFRESGEILFRKYGVSGIVAFNASRFLIPCVQDTGTNTNNKNNTNQKSKLCIDFFPGVKEKILEEAIAKRLSRVANVTADTKTNAQNNSQKNVQANAKNNSQYDSQKNTQFDTRSTIQNRQIKFTRIMAGLLLPRVTRAVLQNANIKNTLSDDENEQAQQIKQAAYAFKNFELQNAKIANPKQCQVSRGGIKTSEVDAATMQIKKLNKVYAAGECIDIDGPCGGYNLHWAWLSGIVAGTSAAKSFV